MGVTDYKEAAKKRRTSKNYVFKGNMYTKSIEQTEDDVSTSSKSTTTTQEKETGESAINVSSLPQAPREHLLLLLPSKINFPFTPPWIIIRHQIWTPPVCT